MHLSIKLVVGGLLLLTCIATMVCALLPSLVNLQDDAMNFVVEAGTSIADQVQFIFSGKLRKVRNFGNVLYRAAEAHNLLDNMQPWALVPWSGRVAVEEDVSALLIRLTDNRGYLVTAYNTIVAGSSTSSVPGNVFLTNFSSPGQYVEFGYFSLDTFAPRNVTTPWTRAATRANYGAQPYATKFAAVANSSRAAPMQWVSLSAIFVQGAAYSVLSYGGRLVNIGDNTTQQVVINIRGPSLSNLLSSSATQKKRSGVEVLLDVSTRQFVSGSITDPSAIIVNGTPQLQKWYELQDPRIRRIFWARTHVGKHFGCDAIMTCSAPCTFTYWPHSEVISGETGGDGSGGQMLDALLHDFVVIRVVEVSDNAGGKGALNMRLVITVPSEDIVDKFVDGFRLSLLIPLAAVCTISVLVVLVVTFVFRSLTYAEDQMQSMAANVFSMNGVTTSSQRRMSNAALLITTTFKELRAIGIAVDALSRELCTLRAFTTNTMLLAGHEAEVSINSPGKNNNSKTVSDPSDEVVTFSSSSSVHRGVTTTSSLAKNKMRNGSASPLDPEDAGGNSSGEGIPYDMGSGKLWDVPVTTLYGAISGEFLCGAGTEREAVAINDPVLALKRQSCVLSLLQRFASHPVVAENRNRRSSTTTGRKESKRNGGDVHHFFGDCFLLHFNASSRAPKHSLSAIYTAVNTLYELEKVFKEGEAYCIPLHFGIASSLALCGLMGPETIRVFTVVSPGEQQAAAMARMTVKVGLPLLMTWRAVEIAKQEQQSIRSVALSSRGGGGSDDGGIIPIMPRVVDCKFVPVANVVLPHEPSKQATTVFTIDADYYRKA